MLLGINVYKFITVCLPATDARESCYTHGKSPSNFCTHIEFSVLEPSVSYHFNWNNLHQKTSGTI